MKKILNILGTITLTATASVSVVSCEKPKTTENNIDEKPVVPNIKTPNLDDLKKEIDKAKEIEQKNKQDNDWYLLQDAIEMAETIENEEEALDATNELSDAINAFENSLDKTALKSYIENTDLGYISSEKVIKRALKIKNPDIPRKVLNNIEYKNGVLIDSTGELSGEVKLKFNDKFKNEWVVDKEGVITASELGLKNLDGTLKVKRKTGDIFLYKKTKYPDLDVSIEKTNLIDLTKRKTSTIPEGVKDYAWWKGNEYITIGSSTRVLTIYKIENRNWIKTKEIEVEYERGYPVNNVGEQDGAYHWDMIDRIDENHFSIAAKSPYGEVKGGTIHNAFTRLKITENKVIAKVNKFAADGTGKTTANIWGVVNGSNMDYLQYFGFSSTDSFPIVLFGVSSFYINTQKALPYMESKKNPAEFISITRADVIRWPTGGKWEGPTNALYWGIAKTKWYGYRITVSDPHKLGTSFGYLYEENMPLPYVQWDDDLGMPISIIQDKNAKIWVNTKDAVYPLVYWTH
ncbi:lipoprotein [Williamsoniiplasma luminosum]|uniref:Lipoprotein n=1 Tax=Williamsoniiplasma luminosum TaxID=214888 RepID=A0A2S0NKE7_9MOLU|nr:lipoprotein [Williamsoniiplasma luminosum]AVP49488.1 MAG: hypothetical protein C5T88_02835 [Williamsoniiplasma luminosum]